MATKRKPEAAGTPASAGGSARRLKGVTHARRLVADVLRAVERQAKADDGPGIGDPAIARILIYGAQVLAGLIHESDLEDRIEALERSQGLRGGGREALQ